MKKEKNIIIISKNLEKLSNIYNNSHYHLSCTAEIPEIAVCTSPECSVLFDINSFDLKDSETFLKKMSETGHTLITTSDRLDDRIKSLLKNSGTAFFVTHEDLAANHDCIFPSEQRFSKFMEKVLLFDDSSRSTKIISSICARFCIDIETITGMESLLEGILNRPSITLINLSTSGFDINVFIKSVMNHSDIKGRMIVPFKDRIDRITIFEINSGINKFARAILSEDEVYSFFVNALFIELFHGSLKKTIGDVDFEKNKIFTETDIRSLYFNMKSQIFSLEPSLRTEKLNTIIMSLNSLKYSVERAIPLKWLSLEGKKTTSLQSV